MSDPSSREAGAPRLPPEPGGVGPPALVTSAVPEKSRRRRVVEGLLFVATWMTLGWTLHLGADAYLLLGVPLTLAFQRVVRRRPLRELWVREGPALRFTVASGLLFALFAATPAISLVKSAQQHAWTSAGWELCAIAGAAAAAYATSHARRETLLALVKCVLVAGGIGCGFMLAGAAAQRFVKHVPLHWSWLGAAKSLLSYWAVGFVLEEVCFRGALDAHLQHPGEPGAWPTAMLVGAVWGLWHLPIVPARGAQVVGAAISLAIVHCAIGIPLSFYWRRSGNLAVTSFTHALIDAFRNGLGLMG